MIRKLRLRLILITMTAVLLVMVILIGGINFSNYNQVVSESDAILRLLMDNGGVFDDRKDGQKRGDGYNPDNTDPLAENIYIIEDVIQEKKDSRGSRKSSIIFFDENRIDSPELAFETRYFTVRFDQSENIVGIDTGRISAVSDATAGEYAQEALRKSGSSGFIGDYRYLIGKPDEQGCRMVIFRDCGVSLANFRNFRNISMFVSVLCLFVVGVLVFIASGRIVRPVAESYEKQKRFITDAGHEIKTPLAIISADVEVLEMDLNDSGTSDSSEGREENEWLSDIKLQTKRLSELTQDLILLSKMEEASTVLEMKDLDLSSIIRSQAGSFESVAIASGKKISSSIEDNIHIHGDRKSIESLLSIIIDNAVKYCPAGGTIDVHASTNKKNALIEITNDTESTLSPDDLKNMFNRFYRTDASRNSETGGYGIGLSIARAIVTKHKGRITAVSPSEKKLTISITL